MMTIEEALREEELLLFPEKRSSIIIIIVAVLSVNTFLFLILLLIVDVFVESSFAAVIPIPSASWHDFVEACLSESGAEVTGECTTWASGNNYGTMPNWDTSLVEDMSGWTGSAFQGFGIKVHSTATFRSGTQRK